MFTVIARVLLPVLVAAFALPPSVLALDDASKCTNSKRKSAGKAADGALKCAAKAAGKGIAVDPVCLTKLSDKLATDFGKAEAKGGCLTLGDAGAVQGTVDACVSEIRSQLAVPGDPLPLSKCVDAKLKASGKKLTKKLGCHATGIKKGLPVSATCLTGAEDKFDLAFAKADLRTDCVTVGDAAAVEAEVDECLADLLSDVSAPTTTTTTAAPTTTTTTLPGACDTESAGVAGITAAHNDVRDSPSPTPVPALDDLCYESDLETFAQAWANGCNYGHNPSSPYGENIYAAAYTGSPPPGWNPPINAVDSWASEAADYNYAANSCSAVCGHYTQIVWRDTERVGCGVRECTTNSPFGPGFPTWTFVVCSYDPPGNFVGQRPY